MLSGVALPFRSSRLSLGRSGLRFRAGAAVEHPAVPAQWVIRGTSLFTSRWQRFRVARHGVDKYAARRLADSATVIYGEYPNLTDITDDRERIEQVLAQVAPSGELFTVYATIYRSGSKRALLLDYLR